MKKKLDRQILRKLAKEAYKKMVKGTPKSRRISFAQAWPTIKASLEAEHTAVDEVDMSAIDGMIEGGNEEVKVPETT